ncbi:alanine racemase [Bacillus spongiae]|uniref:Alanine racemase n=1 Tax=Bacillus spongiae TaxID=2683610 RepID=A0ABU8HJB8_9BACI
MELQKPFFRDTWVEINLDNVAYNIIQLKKHLPDDVSVFVAVKANAYGHGDIQVARTAIESGAEGLAVAFLDEAIRLRKHGITSPILVLGATRPKDANIAIEHNITLTVFSMDWLLTAEDYVGEDQELKLHIKCDTGMGRVGVRSQSELEDIERKISQSKSFMLEGVFTHFATSDEVDDDYVQEQLKRFNWLLQVLKSKPKYIHTANSGASLRFPESYFNTVRFGIAMYGLSPSKEMVPLLPYPLKEVLSLHTRVVHVKKLDAGEKISYGATYETEKDEWIITLPIGYADGWLRGLQGQEVLINGFRAPIVGRVCMDQCMVKVPYEVEVGTKVTLIGKQGDECISVDEIAERLDTINYEIACLLSPRVPRIYFKENEPIEVVNQLLASSDFINNDIE